MREHVPDLLFFFFFFFGSKVHPFAIFVLFLAARVVLQHLKSFPDDLTAHTSLDIIIRTLRNWKEECPLSACFLFQLEADFENWQRTLARSTTSRVHSVSAMTLLLEYAIPWSIGFIAHTSVSTNRITTSPVVLLRSILRQFPTWARTRIS